MTINSLYGLYLISDESLIDQEKYFEYLDHVLSAGPKIFQLRIKNSSEKEILYKSKELRKITKKHNVIFIINDYPEIVSKVNADGLHIGKYDMDIEKCFNIIGNNKILGVSCYGDLERVNYYVNKSVSYIAIGTPYFTKTKPDREPTSLDTMIRAVSLRKNIPIFAIGGIEIDNVNEIMRTGVSGVAVINGVFSYRNSREKILEFNNLLKEFG